MSVMPIVLAAASAALGAPSTDNIKQAFTKKADELQQDAEKIIGTRFNDLITRASQPGVDHNQLAYEFIALKTDFVNLFTDKPLNENYSFKKTDSLTIKDFTEKIKKMKSILIKLLNLKFKKFKEAVQNCKSLEDFKKLLKTMTAFASSFKGILKKERKLPAAPQTAPAAPASSISPPPVRISDQLFPATITINTKGLLSHPVKGNGIAKGEFTAAYAVNPYFKITSIYRKNHSTLMVSFNVQRTNNGKEITVGILRDGIQIGTIKVKIGKLEPDTPIEYQAPSTPIPMSDPRTNCKPKKEDDNSGGVKVNFITADCDLFKELQAYPIGQRVKMLIHREKKYFAQAYNNTFKGLTPASFFMSFEISKDGAISKVKYTKVSPSFEKDPRVKTLAAKILNVLKMINFKYADLPDNVDVEEYPFVFGN